MIYNPVKYVCMVFKPDRFSLKCPLVHLGNTVFEYQEKVKYLGVLLNDNLNDNDDIMKQMRGWYARANSVLRKFAACSFEVKLRLFQAFCTSFYCAHLWYKHVPKVRVACNNVFRLLFGYRRSCSASEMFVYNNIYNFEGRLRKNIYDFTMRIGSSSNVLIATPRENSFILAGPIRQKWITSVYTIYNLCCHRLTTILCFMYCVLCILWCILLASGPEINVILSYLIYLILYYDWCLAAK